MLFARIISKNREVYFLKIITLAVAFASATLITLFSLNEFGYDTGWSDADKTFRVLERNNKENFSGNRLSVKIPLAIYQKLSSRSGDSLAIARVKIMSGVSIKAGNEIHHDQKIHAADPSLLSIFNFHIINGDAAQLEEGVLLSEKISLQYFGTDQPVGKVIRLYSLSDTVSYQVTGVFRDFPANTHEDFTVFIPYREESILKLKFTPSVSGIYGRMVQGSKEDYEASLAHLTNDSYTYSFQPLPEIYFGPRVGGEDAKHGDAYSIWILVCITGLILFLALTSFINLTTLSLPHRSKELAIRKLSGTNHWALMRMFASESFGLVSASFVFGVAILISFNSFLKPILQIDTISLLLQGDVSFILIALALLVVGGLAPLLMAYRFARATPTRLLSTDTITFPRFKRVITFLQLGISIFLIVASLVIRRQVNYSLVKEPGRNHYQIVYMPYPAGLSNEGLYELRAGWKKNNPNIDDVIATSQLPNYVQSKELNSDLYFMTVDRGYREFFNLQVDSGRWFQPNDESPLFVVNKAGAGALRDNHNAIGVVKNMDEEFNTPQKPIKYQVASHTNYQFLCVRIMEVNIRTTMFVLSRAFGGDPAKVSFINTRFEEWLSYQDRLNNLSEVLAVISAILSCFAIYGLSISLVRDKLKQIAIHKLYGAGTARITRLLAREFVRQMGIALLIFAPATFIFLKEFLRNFAYVTPFEWTDPVYPLAYCALVIIGLCGFQALSLNRSGLNSALTS